MEDSEDIKEGNKEEIMFEDEEYYYIIKNQKCFLKIMENQKKIKSNLNEFRDEVVSEI